MTLTLLAVLPGLLIWIAILLLPWRPWATTESLDAVQTRPDVDLSDVTVLIPARNEAETIGITLSTLKQQGHGLKVILVDDQSDDDTVKKAEQVQLENLTIIPGQPLAEGWSGKLWALEQGRRHISTRYMILLDADIALADGLISTVADKVMTDDLQMLSLMANLKMKTGWERFLMPAFIFFFKLLYPFHLSNKKGSRMAAAAGGFIWLETSMLEQLGGFSCIKNALIDDCSLASQVKKAGHRTWTGLTHSISSIRSYEDLSTIWLMVTRTAYTQLFYSPLLLVLCTLLMLAAFVVPLLALTSLQWSVFICGLLTLALQVGCYLPTLRYYELPTGYALTLPFAGILYLLMTLHSAWRHYFGSGASWKGRDYK